MKEIDFCKIESIIGYNFKDKQLLKTAFTHSSYAYTHQLQSNERLEFLGDSVLNFCTTLYLFDNFDFDEGTLSKIRAYLVSSEYVSKYIFKNQLEAFLLCDNFKPAQSTNVMGDLYESIVGAIMLDGGLDACKKFVFESLSYSKNLINDVHLKTRDFKSELQEYVQSIQKGLKYCLIEKSGPPHMPVFKVAVDIDGVRLAVAEGKSKKEAENLCAKIALEKIKTN